MFKRMKVSSLFILAGLALFELISYSSSKTGIEQLVGIVSWARLIAFAFVAVDFAGAGMLFFSSDTLRDSYWTLFAGWVITVLGDVGLAFYNVASQMSQNAASHILVQNGIVSEKTFTVVVPALIAISWAFIQMALVHSLNMVVVDLMNPASAKKVRFDLPRSQDGQPRPQNNQQKKKNRPYPVINFHDNQGR